MYMEKSVVIRNEKICWFDESKFIKTVVVIVIFSKKISCLITLTKYRKNLKMISLNLKKMGVLELSKIRFLWYRMAPPWGL